MARRTKPAADPHADAVGRLIDCDREDTSDRLTAAIDRLGETKGLGVGPAVVTASLTYLVEALWAAAPPAVRRAALLSDAGRDALHGALDLYQPAPPGEGSTDDDPAGD